MAGVWIFAEHRKQTLELLNFCRALAGKMGSRIAAFLLQERELAREYISRGVDEVLILPPLPQDQSLDAYVPVIADEAKKEDPDIILFAGTWRGLELAARVAARLDAGLCSNCTALAFDEGTKTLQMERLAYGGAALQKVTFSSRPAMATVPPQTIEPAPDMDGKEGNVRDLPAPPPSPLKVIGRKAKERQGQDITEARVIVCVGRGLEKKEDLALARELADVLGGAVGCTRPISEENHWLSEDLCIGLSGAQVKPELYVGLGVSGQVQHVTGIRNSKLITAVNRDESAPIFGVADLGIVGDLYDVVPKLLEELRK